MTDTTAQHIAARHDENLLVRLVAAAEQAHIPNPEAFIRTNIGRLISTEIAPGTTITSVHAYATSVYEAAVEALPVEPGRDPAAVTDLQLLGAIQLVANAPLG